MKKSLPEIVDHYHFEERDDPQPLPEEANADADQRLYHSMASSFKKKTADGRFRLMTRKSMQAMLEKLKEEQRIELAAN